MKRCDAMAWRSELIALVAAIVLGSGNLWAQNAPQRTATATFAGGCFWCMEPPFDELPGVVSTTSGYTGGTTPDPTYESVSAGGTGHYEAIQIVYDPEKVSYERLLEVFWRNIDPTDDTGQFCDKGSQYRAAVFAHDPVQRRVAERTKAVLEARKPFKEPVVTQILAAADFHQAEEYHQDYYRKNPLRYKFYRHSCGRDQRLEEVWRKSGSAQEGG